MTAEVSTQESPIKFEETPLYEKAQDMVDWCLLERGCEYFGERDGEDRLSCPSCGSVKQSGGRDKEAFSINKDTAQFHCFHCRLDGQGLDGPRGLRTLLEGGGASSFSADNTTAPRPASIKKATPFNSDQVALSVAPVMSLKELLSAQKAGILPEAEEYFKKRGFSGNDLNYIIAYGSIFTAPAGTQFSFMKYPLEKPAIFFPTIKDGKVIHGVYKLIGGGYYNSPGPKPIYLTRDNPLNNTIVVVEGIFDAFSVYVAGYQGAALLGDTITATHDIKIFKGKTVVVMMDGDEAGQAKVKDIVDVILPIAKSVRVATIPLETTESGEVKVKDANDIVVHHGKERLKELIESAEVAQATAQPEAPVEDAGETARLPEPQPFWTSALTTAETLRQGETRDATPEAPDVTPSAETSEETAQAMPAPSPPLEETIASAPTVETAPVTEESGVIAERERKEAQTTSIIIPHTPIIKIPEICWRGIFADYRKAHAGTTEAPDEFLFGGLLTAAGAALGRCCYVQTGQRLYPNFYVALVGETARSRKTTAARKATDLVESVDPDIQKCFGLSTAEGLIALFEDLEETPHPQIDWEGKRGLVRVEEFSGLLKKAKTEISAHLIEKLQEIYDNPNMVENKSRINPQKARKPTLSLITTTTREKLMRHLAGEDVEGGFANRFTFFTGERKPPIPIPNEPDDGHLKGTVIVALHKARERWKHAKFTLDDGAEEVWGDFYIKEYHAISDETIAELTNRLPDQVMKLALIYAATENDEPVIHRDQMEAAVAWALEYEKPVVSSLFADYGVSEQVKLERRIAQITSNGGVAKRDIHQRLHHVPANVFNSIFDNMVKAGILAPETMQVISSNGRKITKTVYRTVK